MKAPSAALNPSMPYCDVGVGEVGPAEQIHQSVKAGHFTARQLLALHHRRRFHSIHVIDGGDHAQAYRQYTEKRFSGGKITAYKTFYEVSIC